MFHKAHLLFTLLCAGSTIAIVIAVSFLYLRVSEKNLYENQFRSFQNDISTITAGLEESNTISLQWLKRIEVQNEYIIYVIDNGVPFLFNKLSGSIDYYSQNLLSESLDTYHTLIEAAPSDSAISIGSAYSGIWHTEYQFRSPSSEEMFQCSLIDIENRNTLSQIVILRSLTALRAQILRQRLHFLGIDLAAAVVLFVFSWIFTGKLLKPLQENHQAQAQFIAAASHELRTPLSVILASSECCESADAQEQKGFFQTIRKEGKRMNHLIDDMLTLAHSDENHFLIERKEVQLDTLCLNAYEAFEPLCRSRQLTLFLSLPEEPLPRCNCDAERIAQVLYVLLHNAASYTPAGGQITLSLRRYKERTHGFEITVTDTGIGIADEAKKHIFERFYRVEKSRSSKEHFGLGLSIAHEIVMAHHGKITVQDNPGGGSVFVVRLPRLP